MKEIKITKREAVAMYRSQAALARALGISKAAVSQWPEDGSIPSPQAMRLRYLLRPECFKSNE